MPHRVCRQAPLHSILKLSSPALQRRVSHIMCLVLNAAAACPDFGRRTARAHYMQPPPQLAFKLPPRLLELASLQPWCHGNKQRVLEQSTIAHILMRCFSMLALRMCRGAARKGEATSEKSSHSTDEAHGQGCGLLRCVIL